MSDSRGGTTTATFAFGTIFLLMSLAMIAVAFSTNHWQDIYVQRDELVRLGEDPLRMTSAIYFNRNRGIFRTCFPEEAAFLDNEPNMVEGVCLRETGYEIPTRNPDTLQYGDDYEMRIHLMRAWFAALVLAMFFLFIACITAVLGCWNASPSLLRSTGVLVFVGMFFCAAGMGLFHGIVYLDQRVLVDVPGTLANLESEIIGDVSAARLWEATTVTFGYSYMLGWIGLGLAALSGIFFLVVGYRFASKQRETYGSKSARNRAYDYVEKNPYDRYGGGPVGAYPPQDLVYVDNAGYMDYTGYRY